MLVRVFVHTTRCNMYSRATSAKDYDDYGTVGEYWIRTYLRGASFLIFHAQSSLEKIGFARTYEAHRFSINRMSLILELDSHVLTRRIAGHYFTDISTD